MTEELQLGKSEIKSVTASACQRHVPAMAIALAPVTPSTTGIPVESIDMNV